MTGFLGGGHAIYFDAASGVARNLDCFVAVPSGPRGELLELHVPFGAELVHYAVGPASCAVPGCRPASTCSGGSTDGSRGLASASRRCVSRATASTFPP